MVDGQVDVLTDLAHHYAVIFDEELWLSSLSSKSLIDKAAVARHTAM